MVLSLPGVDVVGTDYAGGDGPSVVPTTSLLSDTLSWLAWPGMWGDTTPSGGLVGESSPPGPAYQGDWDPETALTKATSCTEVQGASAKKAMRTRVAGQPLARHTAPTVTVIQTGRGVIMRGRIVAVRYRGSAINLVLRAVTLDGHQRTWTYPLRWRNLVVRLPREPAGTRVLASTLTSTGRRSKTVLVSR